MNETEVQHWMERQFGGDLPPEILDLCHDVACHIKEYVIDSNHWFGGHIDMIRIMIQGKLLDLACEVVRLDRQSEANLFGTARREQGTVPPDPPPRRQPPPLYKHLTQVRARRNGHGETEESGT